MFAFSEVAKGSTGTALLGEGAVEDDGLLALETADEGGHRGFEAAGGHVDGALDVAADVICRGTG